jgi:uncharacterized protein (TIGR02001 family)
MLSSIRGLLAATALAGSLVAVPAYAQDETDPPAEVTVSGYVQGVSDYRFRGLSLSAGDPALQGSINVNHASGFYVGTWASSLAQDPADIYGNLEVDVYGGWTGEVTPGLTVDVGLTYYVYPSGSVGKANVFEPYASLSTTIGPVSAKAGIAYAWGQDSLIDQNTGLPGGDNVYVYTDLGFGVPNVPLSFAAHLGYADGAQSPNFLTGRSSDGGFDYSVGATFNVTDNLSVGASYVGVDGNSINGFSDDTVVATIKLAI